MKIVISKTRPVVELEYLGTTLKVARYGNEEFLEKFKDVCAPHVDQIESKTISAELNRSLMCDAMAGTILVGWEDMIVNPDTNLPYEFTAENASSLLYNDEDAMREVLLTSKTAANYYLNDNKRIAVK